MKFYQGLILVLALSQAAFAELPKKHATQKVEYELGLSEREKISPDYAESLKSGRYCIIIGFSDKKSESKKTKRQVRSNSSDPSMKNAWKFHRKNQSKNLYGINSFDELIAAIEDCNVDNDIIIQTHGFGEGSGGFYLNEKDSIDADDPRFEKLAQALAGRKRVHLWACSVASSTADTEEVSHNFVDKLVNRAYQIAEKKELDPAKPRYYAYTNVMYNSEEGFQAGAPGLKEFDGLGSEVIFTPDAPKSRGLLEQPILSSTKSRKKLLQPVLNKVPEKKYFFESFQIQ